MVLQLPLKVSAPFSDAQKATIRSAVRRAARTEILPRFRNLDPSTIVEKSGPLDLVTEADTSAEAAITRALLIAFPTACIVGEEAVARNPEMLDRIAQEELCFLIDPVDGTWNFARGLPMFGTIIAALRFGRPVYGLIYDPMGDDAIETAMDCKALHRVRSRPAVPVASAAPKSRAELMGYTQFVMMPAGDKALAAQLLPRVRLLSTLRCAAHEYRLLAQGSVDFILGVRMTPWDHAAGVLICQQAGGFSAMLNGDEYTATAQGYLLSASNRAVWDDLADLFSGLLSRD